MDKPWVWTVPDACSRLAKDLGRSKGEVERAFGLSGGALSESRLASGKGEAIMGRLLAALQREGVFQAARRLFVGDSGRRRIERFRDEALRSYLGVGIAPPAPAVTRSEALLMGETGVTLFDEARWDAAVSYLQPAWTRLWAEAGKLRDEDFALMVRVGTALDDWLVFQHRAGDAALLSRALESAVEGRRDGKPMVATAVAGFLVSAAIAYRAEGVMPPGDVLRRCRTAVGLFQSLPGHEDGRIRALRDQAKPLVACGYGWRQDANRSEPRFPNRFEEADAALVRSEDAAGGETPPDPLRLHWLFTRLTRVECLALTERSDDALRLWGRTMEKPWVADLIAAQSHAPLRSKCSMTEMALLTGQGRYDALGETAQNFLADPRNAAYGDRLLRARSLADAAETGDVVAMRRAVLR